MKKYVFFLLLILLGFASCEKDDICIQNPLTPKLVIGFYDEEDPETLKSVDSLYVWAEGKDSIYVNKSINSIELPLNFLESETVYNISKGTLLTGSLTIRYTPKEDYVSRSCGYRFIYNDVTLTTENNSWFSSLTPTNLTTINNQIEHVQVFH